MMSRNSPVEKSSVYFTLLEALEKDGCPVCRIMEEASASYLDTLFYEQVTDVGVRRKLRQARGLCNWHSGRVRDIRPPPWAWRLSPKIFWKKNRQAS